MVGSAGRPKYCWMTTFSESAAVSNPADVPVLDHLDMLCRVLLRGEHTGGSFALVEERAQLGAGTPLHVHEREAETFIVLDGALEGWCDGATSRIEAGSVIHLPAGHEHAFRVASEVAHFYSLITPAGFETFFDSVGRPWAGAFDGDLPQPGQPSQDAIAALAGVLEPLGVRITGPAPFAN
jgi:mannose-6-phosphate isomerase-like protein (cupin superfamily)